MTAVAERPQVAVAHLKFARMGPRKLRRVADAIRGKSVREAFDEAVPFATAPGSAFPASVRVAGPKPGDAANGVARLRGMVTGVGASALVAIGAGVASPFKGARS